VDYYTSARHRPDNTAKKVLIRMKIIANIWQSRKKLHESFPHLPDIATMSTPHTG